MDIIFKIFIAISTLYFSSLVSATSSIDYDCQNNTHISTEQCKTLVKIYQSTDGDNWLNESTNLWLSTSDPCQWEGVICQGSRVVRLELFNFGLKGTLPSLNGLPHLVQLALFNNPNLTGSLPDLVPLNDLTKLVAFNTGLTGFLPDIQKIPQLTHLVVHNSKFIGPLLSADYLVQYTVHGNQLCQSPRINYNGMEDVAATYPVCRPMLSDILHGRLNISKFGAIPDDGQNDHDAISHTLNMVQLSLPSGKPFSNLTIYFPTGVYNVEKSIKLSNFNQVSIVGNKSDILSSHILKGSMFGNNENGFIGKPRDGAIFDFSFGTGLTIKYMSFEGQLKSTTTPELWWDNGLYMGSTKHTNISNNSFLNLGDCALIVATDPEEKSRVINSSDILVTNNYFYNITQTSTTSEIGGSTQYSFIDNTAEHVKGAIKFATRLEGASHLKIIGNTITSAGIGSGITTNNGFEIEGYKQIHVSNNTLKNGDGVGIVIRSSQSYPTQSAYDWESVYITGNTISNYRQAIYISNLPHSTDDSLATASHIVVSDNYIDHLWNGDNQAAIHFVGTQFEECRADRNTVMGGQYAIWPDDGAEWLQMDGNTIQ